MESENKQVQQLPYVSICDRADVKQKLIRRHTQGHYILKGIIQHEEIMVWKYICLKYQGIFKKFLIDLNTIIPSDFNIPLSSMDRSLKHNINKDVTNVNNTISQMALIDIQNILLQNSCFPPFQEVLYPSAKRNTFQVQCVAQQI